MLRNIYYKGTWYALYQGEVDDELNDLYNRYEEQFGENADYVEDAGFEYMDIDTFKGVLRHCLENNIDTGTLFEPVTLMLLEIRGIKEPPFLIRVCEMAIFPIALIVDFAQEVKSIFLSVCGKVFSLLKTIKKKLNTFIKTN